MTPGECPHESRVIGAKSFCELWDRYTNCREVGRCLYSEQMDGQMSIYDLLEDDDDIHDE